jgi:cation diffusion facilitator family transporter
VEGTHITNVYTSDGVMRSIRVSDSDLFSSGSAISAAYTYMALQVQATPSVYVVGVIAFVLFLVILPYFIQHIAARTGTTALPLVHYAIGVMMVYIWNGYRGDAMVSWSTGIISLVLYCGLHLIVTDASPRGHNGLMPFYQRVSKDGSSSSVASKSGGSSAAAGDDDDGEKGSHHLSDRDRRTWKQGLFMFYKHVSADNNSFKIFIFLSINFLFMFVEVAYGIWTNSLGLISDAGHMMFYCMALAIGLYASYISKVKPNQIYTYGYGRYEILSGYVNGVFLLFIGFLVFVEAVERLFAPEVVDGDGGLLTVAILGFGVNLIGIFFFHGHHGHSHGGDDGGGEGGHGGHGDGGGCGGHGGHGGSGGDSEEMNHNMHGMFLHIVADALGSLGVITSSLLIKYKGWYISDPICSIMISGLIIMSVVGLIKDSGKLLLQRTPEFQQKGLDECIRRILEVPGVLGYRAPHFWKLDNNKTMMGSVHLQVAEGADTQKILARAQSIFQGAHPDLGFQAMTVQIEQQQFIVQTAIESRLTYSSTVGKL